MSYYQSILDFRRARRQAERERLRARLTGKSAELLAYEKVRQMLQAKTSEPAGLKDIPLDAIIGSVGRYADFTRSFLPLQDDDEMRWAKIQTRFHDLDGLPPIEVYQMGDVYFVRDGNHRVSVARRLGATHIEAWVTKIETSIPLNPDVQPQDLILKAEYADFLQRTHLDEIRPEADLSVTEPGQYPKLLEQIEVHHYFMGLDLGREISHSEAVGHWYDAVYLPVVEVIREQDALQSFSGRTEADLYLWVSEHRAELEDALDWDIEPEAATVDLVRRFSPRAERRLARLTGWLLDAVTPDGLESGPPPGAWRRERLAVQQSDCMFADILVPIGDGPQAWTAVAQAVEIACRESAHLLGLHIVRSTADAESEKVQAIRDEFDRQCQAAGVKGRLAVDMGRVARTICERSHWADLVVVNLAHPPGPAPIARLGSGFRTLIRRCPTPVMAVSGAFSPLERPLLAYDGSPKAREALYIAAYLAARGQVPLIVVSVMEAGDVTADTLAEAGEYLAAQGVTASLVWESGLAADVILDAAREHDSDLILMGGYGHSPMVEVVIGSTVDQVLRESRCPVLICR